MIQSSVNQMLGTLGIAARMSPLYEQRQADIAEEKAKTNEAEAAVGKAKAAQAGMTEIAENLANENKQYTETELKDIESRVAEHNRNIYTAKTMNIKDHPMYEYAQKAGVEDLPRQAMYKDTLASIESNLEKRRKALDRMKEKGNASVKQDTEFKTFMDSLYKDLAEVEDTKPFKVSSRYGKAGG